MPYLVKASSSSIPAIILSESTTVVLRGPVTAASVTEVSLRILELHKTLPKKKAIILFLDTPGGSISAGNQLIELVEGLPRKVVTVTSFAASMGYQIVQAFSTRYILESGVLMSHRASIGGLSGQVPGEANTRLQWISETVEEMERKTSKRLNMSLNEYKESIRDELWLTGGKAVAVKHADKVVKARCDGTLLGTTESTINTMFGPVEVTLHKCPLISGPVKVKMSEEITKNPFVFKAVQKELESFFSRSEGLWLY